MALLDGKQVRDTSLALAKLDNTGGQGTVTLGTGSMIAVTDAPSADSDLVNKLYADSLASGLDPKESCRLATTADLSATYNGTAGVGGEGQFTGAPTTIDGSTIATGDRILVKDQTDAKQNGIYSVNATTTIWDRALDHDGSPTNEVSTGNYSFVVEGTANVATGYVLTNDQGQTGDLTLNTHNLVWVQFSASSQLAPGAGITTASSKIAVDLDDNTLEFDAVGDAGQLRVNLATPGSTEIGIEGSAGLVLKRSDITGAIIVENGLTETTDGNGNLTAKLGGALTGATSITGASAFDITTTGTQLYITSDSISLTSTGDEATINGDQGATVSSTNGPVQLNTSTKSLSLSTTAIFTDDSSAGLAYNADYSANYTNRTLVDKAFVDNAIAGVSIESTTAGNGLSMNGGTVELGGILTANTEVNGNATYSFNVADVLSTTLAVDNGASLIMNSISNTFTDDTTGSNGLLYGADYSATYVARSLVDKAYVDSSISAIGGEEATTAGNGLSMNGFAVELGGALTQNTTISGDSGTYSLIFNGLLEASTVVNNGAIFVMNSTNNTFTDGSSNSSGIIYGGDYSATFVDRSLVDKGWVDTQISAIVQETTTASNGLTETSDDIALGGALTQNTTIDGASGTYNFTVNDINTLTLATSSGYSLSMNGSATFTDDKSSAGMAYNADYSANFTGNSLVNKTYVDAQSATASILDKNQTASATTADGQTTGTSIAATPLNDAYVEVLVNGQQQYVANGPGEKATSDCYFSSNGTDARLIADITIGDVLYWNGTVALFELSATDSIDYNYSV